MDTLWWFELGALGALTGFVSALLGVSGGLMLVPALYWLLPRAGVTADMVPLVASATALATMVPTSASGAMAQRRRGLVETGWLKRLAPGLVAGSAGGALLASRASALGLSLAFLAYALWFMLSLRARPAPIEPTLPRYPVWSAGGLIGTVSAVVGGGGVNLAVAYLMQRDVSVHRAIGSGSTVGLLLTLTASATFAVLAALGAFGMMAGPVSAAGPADLHLLGLVHWPAALVTGSVGMVAAPYGVRLSARLPARQLKRGFAAVTLGVAVAMLARTLALA